MARLVSYGEYSASRSPRVLDAHRRGAAAVPRSRLHVALPVSSVNWTATEKYTASARHTHYMTNSAESDYAALAGDVAATLNGIVIANDANARLNMAVAARRRLATWPRDHYGYRSDDVREMLGCATKRLRVCVAAGESPSDRPHRDASATRSRDHAPVLRPPSAMNDTHDRGGKATESRHRISILRGGFCRADIRYAVPEAGARPTLRCS